MDNNLFKKVKHFIKYFVANIRFYPACVEAISSDRDCIS